MRALSRPAWAWALYDWANSAFALSVLVVFFGPFFTAYWFKGPTEDAFSWVGYSVTLSTICVMLVAPQIGAYVEVHRAKKKALVFFGAIGVLATAGLALLPEGAWMGALMLRLAASVGFFGSLVCYDTLLNDVSTDENRHFVSGLGFSLGYLGSVLLLVAQFVLVTKPELLGIDVVTATKLTFVSVAVWWVVFTLPLLLWVHEKPGARHAAHAAGQPSTPWADMQATVRFFIATPAVGFFLLAYLVYIDGANTLTNMTSSYAASVGIAPADMMMALILVQIVGVPCALLLGFLGQKYPPRLLITGCIAVYLGVTVYSFFLTAEPLHLGGLAISPLYVLAGMIGIVQGGLQTLSRSYFASLLPDEHVSGAFGFYNMLGKGGALIGPSLMGGIGSLAGSTRWGALAVAGLFAVGTLLLWRAPRVANTTQ